MLKQLRAGCIYSIVCISFMHMHLPFVVHHAYDTTNWGRNAHSAVQVLGLDKTASDDEIKAAHRKLCLKWHPDKNPGSDEAAAEFQKVSLLAGQSHAAPVVVRLVGSTIRYVLELHNCECAGCL